MMHLPTIITRVYIIHNIFERYRTYVRVQIYILSYG